MRPAYSPHGAFWRVAPVVVVVYGGIGSRPEHLTDLVAAIRRRWPLARVPVLTPGAILGLHAWAWPMAWRVPPLVMLVMVPLFVHVHMP